MNTLRIRIYPDPVLKKKSAVVRVIGKGERELIKGMIDAMHASNGVGLAAPQVGISKRIIVAEDLEGTKSTLAFINPKVVKKKGRSSFCEGCLSVPDTTSDVIRPEFIVLEALNLAGDKIKIETGGRLARVVQHEIDHLDGILFIDRIGILKRKKIIKKILPKVCTKL